MNMHERIVAIEQIRATMTSGALFSSELPTER